MSWRTDYEAAVLEALAQLDGTATSAVCLLTGLTRAELEAVGGVEE